MCHASGTTFTSLGQVESGSIAADLNAFGTTIDQLSQLGQEHAQDERHFFVEPMKDMARHLAELKNALKRRTDAYHMLLVRAPPRRVVAGALCLDGERWCHLWRFAGVIVVVAVVVVVIVVVIGGVSSSTNGKHAAARRCCPFETPLATHQSAHDELSKSGKYVQKLAVSGSGKAAKVDAARVEHKRHEKLVEESRANLAVIDA